MNARLSAELTMPVALAASTALGLLAAGVAPIVSAVSAGAAALWLVLVLSLPERGES